LLYGAGAGHRINQAAVSAHQTPKDQPLTAFILSLVNRR